jgi:hypothetical protein
MKKSLVLGLGMLFAGVPSMFAGVETLFLDAGGGVTATVQVDAGGSPSCTDTGGGCGGLLVTPGGADGALQVTGTIGSFTINATGKGHAAAIFPTLQNLNQIEAKNNSGKGTLVAVFTDTGYMTLPTPQPGFPNGLFHIGVSIVNDTQILTSSTKFDARVSSGNVTPAATLIHSFTLTGNAGNGGSVAAAGDFNNPLPGLTTPYTLTAGTTLNFTGKGDIQANFTIATVAVPEPATIMFSGTMLLFTAVGLRRKLRRG